MNDDNRHESERRWWFVSLGLHVAVFGALLWFTPLRELLTPQTPDLQQREQERIAQQAGEQFERTAERIRELQADEIRRRVEALRAIEEAISTLEQAKTEEYETTTGETVTAPTKPEAKRAEQEIERLQQQAEEQRRKAAEQEALRVQKEAEAQRLRDQAGEESVRQEQELRAARAAAQQESERLKKELDALRKQKPKERGPLNQQIKEIDKQLSDQRQEEKSLGRRVDEVVRARPSLNAKARTAGQAAEEAMDAAQSAQEAAAYFEARARRLAREGEDQKARPDLAKTDVPELLDAAGDVESGIAESYQRIRATEMALIRSVPLEEALAATEVALPQRPELDREALALRATTGLDYQKFANEVSKAEQQLDDMHLLGLTMLDAARNLMAENHPGFTVSVESAGAKAGHDKEARQMAKAGGIGDVKDVTSMMAKEYAPGASADLPSHTGTHKPPALPTVDLAALPGRKVAASGQKPGWMFVDSWYVIGPFPNPARQNIDKQFPPETVIDLDAAYEGKSGRIVRWRYIQTGTPQLVPPDMEEYAIYYAWTELYFEEAMDVWIAIGSDDKSHLWINGQLVWMSSDLLKGWQINEGFRKVRFLKGVNRLLYRLENGHHVAGLSLALATEGMSNR